MAWFPLMCCCAVATAALDAQAGCRLIVDKPGIASIAASADGKSVYFMDNYGNVFVWNRKADSTKMLRPQADDFLVARSLCAVPRVDGVVAAADWGSIDFLSGATGKIKASFEVPPRGRPPHFGTDCHAVSPDGMQVAVLGSTGTPRKPDFRVEVRLFDLETFRLRRTLSFEKFPEIDELGLVVLVPRRVAFSPDGKVVLAAFSHRICCWDSASGAIRYQNEKHGTAVRHLVVSADGSFFLSASGGTEDGDKYGKQDVSIRFWDTQSGRELYVLEPNSGLFGGLCISHDSRLLACCTYQGAGILFEVCSGKEIRGIARRSEFANDLVFADGDASLWSATDRGILSWNLEPRKWKKPQQAPSVEELERFWSTLKGDDASRAYESVWSLCVFPTETIGFLNKQLSPIPAEPAVSVRKWIAKLDAEDFEVREEASRKLAFLGPQALPPLRTALAETKSPEVRSRIEPLLKILESWIVKDPETLRQVRAIWVLERIGTKDAQELLKTLADGSPEARPTKEAKSALKRLQDRAKGSADSNP